MAKDLVELVAAHPELPVYAWVNYEVVPADDFACWLGDIKKAYVAKIVQYDTRQEGRIVEYEDKDEIAEYLMNQDEWINRTDEEIYAYVETLPWKECILVYVSTPDSFMR